MRMKTIKLGLFVLLLMALNANGQQWEVGKTYADEQNWVEFTVGDIPLVISVPHGGQVLAPDVPVRDCKNAVTVLDTRTISLSQAIEKVFLSKYGVRPFVIISHISRKQVDQNRDIEPATCGNEIMKKPWTQFHNYIDTALALAVEKFGKAVYIDLHAHAHAKQSLELGYGLNSADLRAFNKEGDVSGRLAKKSYVENVLSFDKKWTLEEVLVGDNALGTLFDNAGFSSIPSKREPYPQENERYLSSGYNTKRYTSPVNHPNVLGVQIECPSNVRSRDNQPRFAKAFTEVMFTYMDTYLNWKLSR